jgi:hypothetical protein
MILALYVIGSTAGLLLLAARLREAREELSRVREEYDDRDRAVRDECSAYAHGVTMSLACLLAGLAAAAWYAPPRPSARPAPGGRAGARAGAPAGGTDGRAAE